MSKKIKMDRKIELSKMVEDVYWDYTVDGEQLLETARTSDPNTFDFKRLFTRAFERMKWVHVLEIFGNERACTALFDDSIRQMIKPQLRGRYDRYRAVLLGKPLPDADKCIKFYRQIRNASFSDRRYGS